MTKQDPVGQLRERFTRPLDDFHRRRVVFWHDADGSFEGIFERLAESGIEGPRKVRFARVAEGGMFKLKRDLNRTHAGDDFLIYTRFPKDLSASGLTDNWLADIELTSEHFQADLVSMLADEVGAEGPDAAEAIRAFKMFFNAADRRRRFKGLVPHAKCKQDVALGVIGATLGCSELTTECIVRMYVCELADGAAPLEELSKYGADGAMASFLARRTGYADDPASLGDLAAHLLLTALSSQLQEGALAGLESRISEPYGQFCLNIVHDWMADDATASTLYEVCRRVEELCSLPTRFSRFSASELASADVFPCINERILCDLFDSMANGADRADEAEGIVQRRCDLRWYGRVSHYFDALAAAVAARRFYRDHAQGFHYAVPKEVWKAYTDDWYRMDTAYRRFCKAVDACKKSAFDIPIGVDDGLEALSTWVENTYVNWFLAESNACWVNASEKAWMDAGYVEGPALQNRFYGERVVAGGSGFKKTMVIVSDALRYEVAVELAERIERETRGKAEIGSMQSVFPSITEFGMAALLPHRSMGYDWEDGSVLLDGEMHTGSIDERERALQARNPKGRCVQSKELFGAKRADRKAMVEGADVVYVYHDKIDAMGEGYQTEHMVVEACDEAIADVSSLVRIAVNDLGFNRVLITADHGFLYTRDPLQERDKVSSNEIDGRTVKIGRRYVISDELLADDPVFVRINLYDLEGDDYVGLAPRECIRIKRPGAGDNYVHGGVSLQECCVPVVEFRNGRTGSKGFEEARPAELSLLSTSRRVTSMQFNIDLYQQEPVGGKILPAEYELVMTDDSGNEVSDVRKAHASLVSADDTARVVHVRFALRAGRTYDAKAPYYLMCRNASNGSMAWKEEFRIEVAFVPMDDFGF